VFHVARNTVPSGKELLNSFEQQLRSILSASWALTAQPHSGGDRGIDAVFELTDPDGSGAHVFIEAKRTVEPRDVAVVLNQIKVYQRGESGQGRNSSRQRDRRSPDSH
jgi:hypothetical protein